jgi:hypothetical protein
MSTIAVGILPVIREWAKEIAETDQPTGEPVSAK